MPRCSGARTGQKQKRAREARAQENAPVQTARLAEQPTQGAAEVPASVSPAWLDDDLLAYRAVADVVDEMVQQLEVQEQCEHRTRVWHDSHIAAAIACAEACKRRAVRRNEKHALCEGAFREAYGQALREWKAAYPEDMCDACERHLAVCWCSVPCSKCGTRVPAREWRLNVGGLANPRLCSCEKISNLLSLVC